LPKGDVVLLFPRSSLRRFVVSSFRRSLCRGVVVFTDGLPPATPQILQNLIFSDFEGFWTHFGWILIDFGPFFGGFWQIFGRLLVQPIGKNDNTTTQRTTERRNDKTTKRRTRKQQNDVALRQNFPKARRNARKRFKSSKTETQQDRQTGRWDPDTPLGRRPGEFLGRKRKY
jgi:hypothetical protein